MSIAAKQLHEYLDRKYPGIRISRKACRDTAGGSVSQHSSYAYGEYDSNALDVMGADRDLGLSYRETQEWLDVVYADIMENFTAWSCRVVLWRVPDHFGHIHIDFYPTCLEHKWCGRNIYPRWSLSDGQTFTAQHPQPENGLYAGPVDEGEIMPRELFEDMIRALFVPQENFQGDPEYWIKLIDTPTDPEWEDFWAAFVRQIS